MAAPTTGIMIGTLHRVVARVRLTIPGAVRRRPRGTSIVTTVGTMPCPLEIGTTDASETTTEIDLRLLRAVDVVIEGEIGVRTGTMGGGGADRGLPVDTGVHHPGGIWMMTVPSPSGDPMKSRTFRSWSVRVCLRTYSPTQ